MQWNAIQRKTQLINQSSIYLQFRAPSPHLPLLQLIIHPSDLLLAVASPKATAFAEHQFGLSGFLHRFRDADLMLRGTGQFDNFPFFPTEQLFLWDFHSFRFRFLRLGKGWIGWHNRSASTSQSVDSATESNLLTSVGIDCENDSWFSFASVVFTFTFTFHFFTLHSLLLLSFFSAFFLS